MIISVFNCVSCYRPVHQPYFSIICKDCKANYEIPPMTSKLRISKSRKYEKTQSGYGIWSGNRRNFLIKILAGQLGGVCHVCLAHVRPS